DCELPCPVDLTDINGARTGADFGAAIRRVSGVQNYKSGVIDETVGVFEAFDKAIRDQGRSHFVAGQIDRAGRRQQVAAADMVIKEQTEAEQPGRPQAV